MTKTQNKLQKTGESVDKFIDSIADLEQRADTKTICALMEKLTGKKAEMWGYSIIGFGNYHYKYESGREGDVGVIGMAPRKNQIVLYIVNGYDNYGHLLDKLGKYSIGKTCLYIKRLSDIDLKVLEEMMKLSIKYMKSTYQTDLK